MMKSDDLTADCILVGGGLSNSLAALALKAERPELKIKLIERASEIGGNHTWSFHSTDFGGPVPEFIKPLVVKTWQSQEVRFPKYARSLSTSYNSVSSGRLAKAVRAALGSDIILNAEVVDLTPTSITLNDQRRLTARCVIDGRGALDKPDWQAGYQKFFGLEIELEQDSGLENPILMDATVPQIDGYRFVYTLPFEARRLLIEDTYYSSSPELDEVALEKRIRDYAAEKGWRIARVIRSERGVLPIPLNGGFDRLWGQTSEVPRAGLRAMMFHPTTGYSLPDAARVASRLAGMSVLESEKASRIIRDQSRSAWLNRSFFRMLNRLMFVAAEPSERLAVMQRFYTLPESLIDRFYACELTLVDKARILTGKPPISFFRALDCVREPA
jgi:lycopene beta-cyclase